MMNGHRMSLQEACDLRQQAQADLAAAEVRGLGQWCESIRKRIVGLDKIIRRIRFPGTPEPPRSRSMLP